MENKIFGERIKGLRIEKKMTQQELGNIVGLTSTGISYWETGKAVPNLETLVKLSNFFGISVDYLTGKNDIDNKEMILFRKAERVNDKDKEKLYNIIESTIDIFLMEQDKNEDKS